MVAQIDSITLSDPGETSADAQLDSDTTVGSRQHDNEADIPAQQKHEFSTDYRFWMVMLTLVFSTLLVSLESTVVITSLPTIVTDIDLGSDYIWVTNIFFLTRYLLFSSSHSHNLSPLTERVGKVPASNPSLANSRTSSAASASSSPSLPPTRSAAASREGPRAPPC